MCQSTPHISNKQDNPPGLRQQTLAGRCEAACCSVVNKELQRQKLRLQDATRGRPLLCLWESGRCDEHLYPGAPPSPLLSGSHELSGFPPQAVEMREHTVFGPQWGTHNTWRRSSEILDRGMSTLRTFTSTFSPGPRPRLRLLLVLDSFASVMNRIGINPAFPTPISTKTPNRVAFSTLPVRTVPTCRSSRHTMLLLKSGLSKSVRKEDKR